MRDHAGDSIDITIADFDTSEYTFDISSLTSDTIDISNITTSTMHTTSQSGTITLDDTHWADEITWENTEFEDCMPSVAKVEDMCNDYPALEKAYENFKMIYKMVHQDWKGRQDDETPF